MKWAFIHDNFFYEHQNKVYSESHFFTSMWDRYLKHSSELLVIGRKGDLNILNKSLESLNVSSGERIKFILLSETDSVKSRFFSNDISDILYKNLQNVDGVVCRVPSYLGNLAAKVCEENNIPYALEIVGSAWDSYWNYGTVQAKVYAPIIHFDTRSILEKSKFSLFVTSEFLQKTYPPKNALLSLNASNIELVPYDLPEKVNIEKNITTLGVIGQIHHKYKGIHFLIKALGELNKHGHLFELRILGPGDESYLRDYAKKYDVEKHVHFDGVLKSGKDVYMWLDDIDIYVQPSLQEGLPRALIEAMSREIPCIGTTAGGMYELLPKEYICKAGNWKCLKRKILELSEDKEKMRTNGLRNLQISTKYEKTKIDTIRENFYDHFKKYINERRK